MLDQPLVENEMRTKHEIAIATIPLMGHLMPLLPYAEELLRRGHTVTFFHESHPKYRQKLTDCGLAACESVTYQADPELSKMKFDEVFHCVHDYYEKQGRVPSVVVYDFFAVGAADAADLFKVPAVGVYPNPLSLNPWAATVKEQSTYKWALWGVFCHGMEGVLARALWFRRNRSRWSRNLPMLKEQDVYPSLYMPRTMIGCTCPELEFPNIKCSPLFHMVGPAKTTMTDPMGEDLQKWIDAQTKPIVYVAFGTMFKYTDEVVQSLQAQLLNVEDVAVLWSLKTDHQEALRKPLPSSWRVEPFVPQIALLDSGKIRAFVTHCGSNSIHEALLAGVPMVCCPGFADQPANATRMARAGVGVIARTKQENGVEMALRELFGNLESMTNTSKELAKVLQAYGGAEQAATIIEKVAAAGGSGGAKNVPGRCSWAWGLLLLPLFVLPFVLRW